MPKYTKRLIDELEKIQTKDKILVDVHKRCLDNLKELEYIRSLAELRIFVVHFNNVSDTIRSSVYNTDSLKAVFDPPTVIVTDDLASYRIAEEKLGIEHQVCQPVLDGPFRISCPPLDWSYAVRAQGNSSQGMVVGVG